ncbi:acyl-CoA dehydrogenase [Gluconacetobacter sacchari DSM 12717]|uniref:Acyl-CoA dehydrogenase n=2 Tax=Gluconacetobacter sacchari TaxID=92759 RepID=A0A7W4IGP4_9PROT|nr:acyl-CoA dehydrogenase [Gluconacetobacter sacchari]MBB2162505.1 acyl-CoA dehydrogenase [Gluconacetobacter sacchari]GBQ32601.1 acyl-CoA dehydrogenase [Gluconacetobacter sacchari DSM 12717]
MTPTRAAATQAASCHEPAGRDALMRWLAERADGIETDPASLAPEIAAIGRAGLLAACLSIAEGGQDLGLRAETAIDAFDWLRRMGRANLSVARLFEGHMNAAKLLHLYGGQAQRTRVAQAVRQGALLGVWGADGARPLRCATIDGRHRLDGEKIFASGLGLVRFAVVTLRDDDDDGSSRLALVDVSDPGRQDPSAWKASGMRATCSGRFDFTGLEIDAGHHVGQPGAYACEPHFEGGTWRYCAAQLGGAEALVDLWRARLADMGRLEDPMQSMRYARAVSLCRAMASLLRETCQMVETAASGRAAAIDEAVAAALLAREFVEESCAEILHLAEKSLGTAAYVSGTAIERVRRDLSLFLRQANPDGKLLKAGRLLAAIPPW